MKFTPATALLAASLLAVVAAAPLALIALIALPTPHPEPRIPSPIPPVRVPTESSPTDPPSDTVGSGNHPPEAIARRAPIAQPLASAPLAPSPQLEPDFAAFLAWSLESTVSPDWTARGVDLARRRRDDLADLIRSNPRRALELAVPHELRRTLPAPVVALLETRVTGVGDLEVLCSLPDPTSPNPPAGTRRFAVFGEDRYEAFVYGRRLGQPTLRATPLQGIAIDGLMAIDEQPGSHLAAAGGPALAAMDGGSPSLQSAATEGARRLIFIRVDFTDLVGEPFSSNRTVLLTRELDRFYRENSYGRSGFHEIGAGSEVTPVFRLSRTAASYGAADASGALRTDARNAARAAGYNLAAFDYDLICFGSVPGFGYAGLGFVGAPGAWIRGTSSTGVVAHELGHNYGLQHANFWDTGGESTTGTGSEIEYGDKFDTMGAANAGQYHFNARYKRLLGWLKPGEFTVVTSNGTYRIHAHDQTNNPSLSRGLQVFTNARTNYWVEFRQRFTSNPWLLNGAGLRWAGRGSESSVLLDTTPGTSREKDDAAIVLGRTFSNTPADIHLTPVAKGGSDPAWIDIVVQRGPFPDNHPPTLTLSAPTTSGSTATPFSFTASASDPDSDTDTDTDTDNPAVPLAYHWEFGDETIGPNSPTATHRWTSPGEYTVLCTVSDTRGGTARSHLVVRVGSPTTVQASGRVTRDGEPVPGARVGTGSGRQTFTDTHGSYTLAGLPVGTHTLTASLDGDRFTPASFRNPVPFTRSLDGLDFAASDPAGPRNVTLLPAGSSWRFWDKGAAPAPDWLTPGFDDSAWDRGAAILGYGGDRETTVISFGSDSSRKFTTTWFRCEFVATDPSRLSNVRLGLLRDDGAAVHLNGAELLRDNLPAGTLTAQTLALSATSGAGELTYFEFDVDPSRLNAGTNLFAVEIHQSSGSSSDIAFDLRLIAEAAPDLAPGLHLTRPADGDVFTTPARIGLAATLGTTGAVTPDAVVFLADNLELGRATSAPYAITWNTAGPGDHLLTSRAILADGSVLESAATRITVRDTQLTPTLIRRRAVWRYLDTGVAPADSWRTPEYDATSWASGPARLGYGEDGEFTVVDFGPDPARKRITTWFRHAFEIEDAASITNLLCRLQRDDGAVVHLNDSELFRVGLRTGTLSPTSLATSDVGTDAEQTWIERSVAPTALREGTNIVAVELHQSSPSSSDLGFDLELVASRSSLPAQPPRLDALITDDALLRLAWSATATATDTAWRLESSTSLGPEGAWLPVASTPSANGDRLEVSLPASARAAFFRLSRTTR